MATARYLINEFKGLEGNGVTVEFTAGEYTAWVAIKHDGRPILEKKIRTRAELENFYIQARAAVDNINFINEIREVLDARE